MFVVLCQNSPDKSYGYLSKSGEFGCLEEALVIEDYQEANQTALEQAKEHNRLCKVEHLHQLHAERAARQRKVCRQHQRTYRKAAYEYLPFQRTFVRVVDEDNDYDPDNDPLEGIDAFDTFFIIMKADQIEGYVAEIVGVVRTLTEWEAEAVADYFAVNDDF